MFPKLRLKLKPNLISLTGGMQAIPCTDPSMRATALEPHQWRQKLAEVEAVNTAAAQSGQLEKVWACFTSVLGGCSPHLFQLQGNKQRNRPQTPSV
jgi:hypothetical protein